MTDYFRTQAIGVKSISLLLISLLFTALVANAQYSGFVGDQFTIPDPPDRMGYTAMNATFGTTSPHLYVSAYGTVQIRSYFTGSELVFCNVLYVRSDGSYGSNIPATLNYYVTCKPRTITGLPNSVTMEDGEEKTLNWSISPYSASVKITWESSNSNVVSVNSNGKLKAKSPGFATVTAQNNSGPDEYIYVTVNENKKVSLTASPSSSDVFEGTVVKLTSNVTGTDIYYTLDGSTPSRGSTKYTSAGITINESCTLKAIGYKEDYETSEVLTERYNVILPVSPTSISIFVDSKTIGIGESLKATYYISPTNANVNTEVTWKSDDSSIASVNSSGQIVGVNEGITYIRVSTTNGCESMLKIKVIGASVFDDGIGIATFATSGQHTLIVKKDGTLWACGKNDRGELCDGTKNSSITPKFIMNNVVSVAAGSQNGENNSFIIKRDGTLWVCGEGYYGVLGTGSTADVLVPQKIMDDVVQVSTTGYRTRILKKDGTLWACGDNYGYGLGIGSSSENTTRSTPVKILSDVAAITPGSNGAIKKDNTLWAWGDNSFGVLGDGTTTAKPAPIKILDDVVTASCSSIITNAVKKDGTLWSCGGTIYHYLCDGTQSSYTFKHVMDSVKSVLECSMHFIIKQDGSLWGYGLNNFGQLGIGSKADNIRSPVKIMEDVDSIASGGYSSFVRKIDGSLWAFGSGNSYGQLCNGTTEAQLTPVKVMNAPNGKPYEITLQCSEDSVEVGKTITMGYTVKPLNATSMLKWSSDDPTIASVNSTGMVKGIRPGTTYINVETENGKTDWLMVKVYAPKVEIIKTSAAGCASFFSSESAYILPNGLSAQVVTSAANNKLTCKTIADGSMSSVIPKGTAVMLVSDKKQAGTFTLTSSESTATYNSTNLLHGSDEATTTTGNGSHYKLSYGPSGTQWSDVFGWYWGAQNGAPFQIEGHKAWLVVPNTNSSRAAGFTIDGDATELEVIEQEVSTMDHYYDLQGRRVNHQPTRKGVYIKNGKKMIVK